MKNIKYALLISSALIAFSGCEAAKQYWDNASKNADKEIEQRKKLRDLSDCEEFMKRADANFSAFYEYGSPEEQEKYMKCERKRKQKEKESYKSLL